MILAVATTELGALGWGLLILHEPAERSPPLLRLSVAWLVGTAAEVIVLYGLAAGARFPRAAPLVLTLGGLGALTAAAVRAWPRLSSWLGGLRLRLAVPEAVLAVVLVLPVAVNAARGLWMPVTGFDGLAMWTAKTGFLVHGEGLRGEAFTDPARVHPHPGYPIGFPLLQARHAACKGEVELVGVSQSLAALVAITMVLVAAVVARHAGSVTALLVTSLLLWSPPWTWGLADYYLTSGYVDPIVGLVVAATFGLAADWLVACDQASLVGAVAGMVVLGVLKNEGLVWAGMAWLGLVLAVAVGWHRLHRPSLGWLAVPVVAIALTRLAHLALPSSSDVRMPRLPGMGSLVSAVAEVLRHAATGVHLDLWLPVLQVVAGLVLLLGWWRCPRVDLRILALSMPAWVGVVGLVMVAVYLNGSDVEYYARLTLPRLIDQCVPGVLVLGVILSAAGRNRSPA